MSKNIRWLATFSLLALVAACTPKTPQQEFVIIGSNPHGQEPVYTGI